jgi:hypothetical protein
MEGADRESERTFPPSLADELARCESSEGLEAFCEVIGHEKRLEM